MELRLRKLGVWSIVNGEESRPPGSNNHKTVKGWVTRSELALNEIVSAVGDSQLVHTRVSMDPSIVWERLESVHMSQGLGSVISMWQRFFQLKKTEEVTIQAHAASIREYADRLTGLGDSPSETLMVAVLLISLPESYSPLIVSLDTHPDRAKFDFVVQRCINEEAHQLSITHSKQSSRISGQKVAFSVESKLKKDKKNVTGVIRRDITRTNARKNCQWRKKGRRTLRRRRRAKQQQPSQSLQTPSVIIRSGDSGGMVILVTPALEGVCWK